MTNTTIEVLSKLPDDHGKLEEGDVASLIKHILKLDVFINLQDELIEFLTGEADENSFFPHDEDKYLYGVMRGELFNGED